MANFHEITHMKITQKQLKIFTETYDNCLKNAIDSILQHKKDILYVVNNHDFKTDLDFNDFAKEAFLHHMKQFHDHHYSLEAAILETKRLLEG